MKWSFSAHGTYRRCPRQWFYKQIFANSRAKDPIRQEAYRLSKLEGIQAWRGKIVDTVISDAIIPSITRGRPITVAAAQRTALGLFDTQRAQRTASKNNGLQQGTGFYEFAYGGYLSDEQFARARKEVAQAIDTFYQADPVWDLLRQAHRLFPQRSLMFTHGDVTVQVVPDLLMFRNPEAPVIFDWKVNTRPLRDYWLQLVTAAIAITRCNPHSDWPRIAVSHQPNDIALFEVQLLTGIVRPHTVTVEDVAEAEDFISLSATEMLLARGEDTKQLTPEDFPVTTEPRTCQLCAFRKLCWGSQT